MNGCAVVIVTYFPDKRLEDSVKALQRIELVREIIIVDNTGEKSSIVDEASGFDNVTTIRNEKNMGIAYAQNIGLDLALKKGYAWALTLDHDTIISERLIKKYFDYLAESPEDNVGILTTDYLDIGTRQKAFDCKETTFISESISSGSLINLQVFRKIGKMKEKYFIDQVDNEYCYRLRRKGYDIVLLPGCDMQHRLGNIEQRRFLGKAFFVYNQSPVRTFYRTRNTIWFMKEYKDSALTKYKMKELLKDFCRLIFERDTFRKYCMFFKGVYYGIRD